MSSERRAELGPSASQRPRCLPSIWLWLATVAATCSAFATSCLELRDEHDAAPSVNECARCHGDAIRQTNDLLQAAPPSDVKGNTDVRYPGVGAHAIHLQASDSHPAFECEECHVVPETNDAEGHYDSDLPAELAFGPLARHDDHEPHYDASARSCENTYCHGSASPVWTLPRRAARACGSCHGLPPPAPHPQFEQCSQCHGEVIGPDGDFADASKHVDGVVQSTDSECSSCHGGDHGPAPPRDLDGHLDTSYRGVGAHQAHLAASAGRSLACGECHVVPDRIVEPGHLDGSGVQLMFSGVGLTRDQRQPEAELVWNAETLTCSGSWCHSLGSPDVASPQWTQPGPLACDSCHGSPPAAPHPQVENCTLCHGEVIGPNHSVIDSALHVDGIIQARTPDGCTDCHGMTGGDERGPPPRDTLGNTETSARGVGAHQAHLGESDRARMLHCDECHRVPDSVSASDHLEESSDDVNFTGVALAFSAQPSYVDGSCADTYCHGGSFIGGRPSGGQHTEPDWTLVDGSQATCESCHGMPPPEPHPQPAEQCNDCHKNIDGGHVFSPPESHVDGKVNFFNSREEAAEALQ